MGDTTATSGRGLWALVVAAVALVGVYLWDDLIFAAPVVATSAWLGPLVAFAVLAPIYGAGSWIVAMAAVRAYERASAGEPSRLATWLEHQRTRQRSAWGARLLDGGRLLGFVVASFVIGGILTTWFLRYSGRRDGIARLGAWSCAIFGITFVGVYAGVAAAIFGR